MFCVDVEQGEADGLPGGSASIQWRQTAQPKYTDTLGPDVITQLKRQREVILLLDPIPGLWEQKENIYYSKKAF